mmetsp:Transcript_24217/g.68645  ORF Transcript_24217/g.68645 Transcript_24217/m.68645 type:complete len:353 (-) Transcript_24217:13-1071(-)
MGGRAEGQGASGADLGGEQRRAQQRRLQDVHILVCRLVALSHQQPADGRPLHQRDRQGRRSACPQLAARSGGRRGLADAALGAHDGVAAADGHLGGLPEGPRRLARGGDAVAAGAGAARDPRDARHGAADACQDAEGGGHPEGRGEDFGPQGPAGYTEGCRHSDARVHLAEEEDPEVSGPDALARVPGDQARHEAGGASRGGAGDPRRLPRHQGASNAPRPALQGGGRGAGAGAHRGQPRQLQARRRVPPRGAAPGAAGLVGGPAGVGAVRSSDEVGAGQARAGAGNDERGVLERLQQQSGPSESALAGAPQVIEATGPAHVLAGAGFVLPSGGPIEFLATLSVLLALPMHL